MEDFGSIVWTLVLVGFGIYSFTAQKRKKETETPKKHEEAWPSWDPWAEDSEQEQAQQEEYKEQQSEVFVEKESVPMKPEFEEGTDAEPSFSDEQTYAEPSFSHEQAASEPAFTQEQGAIKSSPATTFTVQTAAVSQPLTTYKTRSAEPSAGKSTKTAATSTSALASASASHDTAEGFDPEEFDLRRAIIYSEILKPKFDE